VVVWVLRTLASGRQVRGWGTRRDLSGQPGRPESELVGKGDRQVKGTWTKRRTLRRRVVGSGSRTGPDALGHNLGRGRSVDPSGSSDMRVVVFPGNTGSGRHGKPAVEAQAIIAQRQSTSAHAEEDRGSTPHASDKDHAAPRNRTGKPSTSSG